MIELDKISTDAPKGLDREKAEKSTEKWVKEIGEMHDILYAEKKHSVLIVLQGMDASGKDGAIANVFHQCSAKGLYVVPFKKPSPIEMAHDFLWRVHAHAPAKGFMTIFVRSHYEDVLIQRVHNWIDEERVRKRLESINAFEKLLAYDNNTLILKFYLHISYEQQEVELKQRLNEKDKFYKHNPGDWEERKLWKEYRKCYEDVLNFSAIPWHIVPVDQRWYRNYVMSKIVRDALKKLDMEYPPLPEGAK